MFTEQPEQSLAALGEVRLIKLIGEWLGSVSPESPEGMGDDCAVHPPAKGRQQLLTTDSLTYGQHFDGTLGAADAGAKLIKRNLSDIAAMGAHRALPCSISCAAPTSAFSGWQTLSAG